MRDYEIIQWLQDDAQTMKQFMDYSPFIYPSAKPIEQTISSWLNNHRWNDDDRSVASLGFDSMGGQIVHWGRPGADAVVVYFGSEGGFGVLAPSLVDWVRAIARGSTILESSPSVSLFVPETRPRSAAKALRTFQRYTEQRFGLGEGPPDLSDLNAELSAWVVARRQIFSMQDLMRLGLQGEPDAGLLRARVCAELGLRKSNAKALVKRLNASDIDPPTFERAVEVARADVGL